MVKKPGITIARKSGAKALAKRVAGLTRREAYVGIPASSRRQRSKQLLAMAGKVTSAKRKQKLVQAATEDISNAELLFVFSEGSPLRNQPARPVLQPAVQAEDNKQKITRELSSAMRAGLVGDKEGELRYMQRAALAGQNAARKWFTDSRNGWAPNAPATVAAKGSDKPGINTGAMRAAIVGLVKEN